MYDESVPGFYYDDSPAVSSNVNGGGPGVLDYLNWGGSTATGLLGALKQSRAATAPASPTNWGLIIGIGAAVLVGFVVIGSLFRGR